MRIRVEDLLGFNPALSLDVKGRCSMVDLSCRKPFRPQGQEGKGQRDTEQERPDRSRLYRRFRHGLPEVLATILLTKTDIGASFSCFRSNIITSDHVA
jgi:hypothetical protein